MNALESIRNVFVAALAMLGIGQSSQAPAPVEETESTTVARNVVPSRFASFPVAHDLVLQQLFLVEEPAHAAVSTGMLAIQKDAAVMPTPRKKHTSNSEGMLALRQIRKNLESEVKQKIAYSFVGNSIRMEHSKADGVRVIVIASNDECEAGSL